MNYEVSAYPSLYRDKDSFKIDSVEVTAHEFLEYLELLRKDIEDGI